MKGQGNIMYVSSTWKPEDNEKEEKVTPDTKEVTDVAVTTTSSITDIATVPVKKTEENRKTTYKNTGIPEDREFELFCRKPQAKLKALLVKKLKDLGYEPIAKDGFIYAKGETPVLLTAHMDTVHTESPYTIITGLCDKVGELNNKREENIVTSPEGIGGDDRCGIYMIMRIIKTQKCSVVFCEDEETGCIGSSKFIKDKECVDDVNVKFIIEFDRKGEKDAVYYDCDNQEFSKFVSENTYFTTAYGSCSDISILAPALKVAAVNLSCGYYNPHTLVEYIILSEVYSNIKEAQKLIAKAKDLETPFEYIKKKYPSYSGYYSGYGKYDDYYDGEYYGCYDNGVFNYEKYKEKKEKEKAEEQGKAEYLKDLADITLEISFIDYYNVDENGEPSENTYIATGKSKMECWGDFFTNNPGASFNDVLDYYVS